jgi:hypothetical protein
MIHDGVFLGVMLLGLLIAAIQTYMAWAWIIGVRRRTKVRQLEQTDTGRPTDDPNQRVGNSSTTTERSR